MSSHFLPLLHVYHKVQFQKNLMNIFREKFENIDFWLKNRGAHFSPTMNFPCTLKTNTFFQPFKRKPHKMVKHTQTIRRQFADELFQCLWPFCKIGT